MGAQLDLTWSARLQDHLGSFKVELVRARTVNAMNDRILTAGLTTVSTILSRVLPERHAYDNFYRTTEDLLDFSESAKGLASGLSSLGTRIVERTWLWA